jgi:hypothetical protein
MYFDELETRKAQFTRLERCVFYFYVVLIVLLCCLMFGIPIYMILSS